MKRTDYCGRIDRRFLEQTVTLTGWVHRRRDHGGVIFIDLRDREGLVQVVCDPDRAETFATAESLRNEFCIEVTGRVRSRPAGTVNTSLVSGEIEVLAHELTILNASATPPFQLDDENLSETVRLEHRVIDLRRPQMQRNLMLRYRTAMSARKYLDAQGFIDIETPMLYKSTPEGAREFLVPSRIHHGQFYALPQSPQLFKQMLMVAGFDRYYQITKCFRDEDLRADRQPEFTQIDIETSFLTELEIREMMEGLVRTMWKEAMGVDLPDPFPIKTYAEVMSRYGSDKPDLRVSLELTELTDLMKTVDFKVFRSAADMPNGRVAALRVPGGGTLTRKEIDDYTTFVKIYGAGGLAYIKVNDVTKPNEEGLQAPVVKFLTEPVLREILVRTGAANGDVIFFGADKEKVVNDALGALRAKIGHDRGFATQAWKPLWVVDFPMFEYDDEKKTWAARHHPFTAPKDGHEDKFSSDPGERHRQGLRRRDERLGDRRRVGAYPSRRGPAEGVRGARHLAGRPAEEVRLPPRCAAIRRAAAWRHRLRPRSHRHADVRRRVDPRRDRLPQDATGTGHARGCPHGRHRAAVARPPHPRARIGCREGELAPGCRDRAPDRLHRTVTRPLAQRPLVTVVGSANVDMILACANLPRAGETVLAADQRWGTGGKGANQAVAAARLGAAVSFVGCIGADASGQRVSEALADEGIDVAGLRKVPDRATGIAVVAVDPRGDNLIIVQSGANAALAASDVTRAAALIQRAAIVVCQLETPLAIVEAVLDAARGHDTQVWLNPAPAQALPASWFRAARHAGAEPGRARSAHRHRRPNIGRQCRAPWPSCNAAVPGPSS